MSEEEPPIRYCPCCGRELSVQHGLGTKTEITPKDEVEIGIIKNVLSFCGKCDLMYVFNRELDGFTVRAIERQK